MSKVPHLRPVSREALPRRLGRVRCASGTDAASVLLGRALLVQLVSVAVVGESVWTAVAEARTEEVGGLRCSKVASKGVTARVLTVPVLQFANVRYPSKDPFKRCQDDGTYGAAVQVIKVFVASNTDTILIATANDSSRETITV